MTTRARRRRGKKPLPEIAMTVPNPPGWAWREMREASDLTQIKLARLLWTSEQTVRRWENDKCQPKGPTGRCLRIIYLQHIGHQFKVLDFLKDLARREMFT